MTDTRTTTIDARDLGEFNARLAVLNKRAAKLSVAPVTYEITDRFTVKRSDDQTLTPVNIERVTLDITGSIPRLPGGWKAIGVVTHEQAGNLLTDLRTPPEDGNGWTLAEATRVENYRNAGPDCDHCNVRRNRSKTIILESDTEGVRQVGSSCLVDFLGYGYNPEDLIGFSSDAAALDGPFSSYREEVESASYLAAAAASIRVHGWIAKSANVQAPADTTASVAWYVATGTLPRPQYSRGVQINKDDIEYVARVEVNDSDRQVAAVAQAWGRALPVDSVDYLGNLRVVASQDFVAVKHIGLLASLITASTRDADRAARQAAKAAKQTAPVPETDERIVIEGVVKSIAEKANDFGVRWVFTVEDDRGFRVWGTIPKAIDPSIGDRVRFTAKVERSSDDETFGFIKRPTKPEILPAVAA